MTSNSQRGVGTCRLYGPEAGITSPGDHSADGYARGQAGIRRTTSLPTQPHGTAPDHPDDLETRIQVVRCQRINKGNKDTAILYSYHHHQTPPVPSRFRRLYYARHGHARLWAGLPTYPGPRILSAAGKCGVQLGFHGK